MGIRDNLAGIFGGRAASGKTSVIGLSSGELPDRALEKTWDDWTLLSTYGDDAWPYICATKVAEQGSLPPLRFGRTDGNGNFKAVPPTHPVQDLFDRPNPLNTGGELRQLLLLYLEMVGHAPIEVVRPSPAAKVGRSRAGFELYTHNPGPWRIVANKDGTIRGYVYLLDKAQGQAISREDLRWDATQMTYLRWPNPTDRWYGQGRIAAVRQAIMAEEYAAIRDKKFEQQLGVPPGILTSEMPLGSPVAEELQRRWEKAVGGYANAGRIAVLGSKTTYQQVSVSRKDQEWLATRHWRVQEIAGAFEVPLILVLMSDATYANAKEARAEWWEGSLSVKLQRIQEMCTERLLPMLTDEPLEARFDLSRIEAMNENQTSTAERAVLWSKAASVKRIEIRNLLGLPPLGDERDEEIVLPGLIHEFGTAGPGIDAQIGTPNDAAQPRQSVEGARQNQPASPPTGKPKAEAPTATKRRDPVERNSRLEPIGSPWKKDLGAFFLAQRNALRVVGKGITPTDAKGDPDRSSQLERAIELLLAERFLHRFQRISEGPISAAITFGVADTAETLGVKAVAADEVVARVGVHTERLGVGIRNTTVNDVSGVIRDWLESDAADLESLQGKLDDLFDGYQSWRTERIARTELVNAYNLGAIDQYRSAGVQLVSVSDGDGDEPCARANGSTWTLEEAEGNPTSHPNCTRDFTPITEGIANFSGDYLLAGPAPEATKDDGEGVVRFEFKMPAVNVAAPAVSVAAPIVNVPQALAPIIHPTPAPVVNVETESFTSAVLSLRQDIIEMRADIAKPRKRRLIKDDFTGRVTGSEDVAE